MMEGTPGTVVELNAMDSLGWIELDGGGGRIRFGGTALHGFAGDVPLPGARVRVIGTTPGFRGVLKAVRVVPIDFKEPEVKPLDTRAALAQLELDVSLAREDWPKTLAALVAHYTVGSPASHRDRAFATTDEDGKDVRALLEQWLGEPIPQSVRSAIDHAADVLLIRYEHEGDPDDGRQLFEIEGHPRSLFVLRTSEEREDAEIHMASRHSPNTSAALHGIYRYEGARPSFIAHAPACSQCQAQLRSVIAEFGQNSITSDFLALVRP
jgi:hypothetical protein